MQTMLAERMGSFLQVHNFHYSTDVDGRVEEGSMEVDAKTAWRASERAAETEKWWRSTTFKLGVFSTGAGNAEYHTVIVLINEILQGITGIYFSGGGKCYIRSQIKAFHPGVEKVDRESSVFEMSLIWVAAEEPLKDRSFLSSKILGLCGDRPIFWLHPTEPKGISQDSVVTSWRQVALVFDPMICEPLGGYWPWPYNYRGCRSACRIILPCRWWVARIMGIV
uniref:Leukocyte cell-derived chemotaxin 1 n=1 Tax=Denticeps clupeoides TaxID=299321 RepID=A0AAY4DMZ9_9TELE